MRKLIFGMIYVGIGCAYQSTYDDVTVRQIVMGDAPISALGHILAWPLVILYHMAWYGIIGVAAACLAVVAGVAIDDWRVRRARTLRALRRSA